MGFVKDNGRGDSLARAGCMLLLTDVPILVVFLHAPLNSCNTERIRWMICKVDRAKRTMQPTIVSTTTCSSYS